MSNSQKILINKNNDKTNKINIENDNIEKNPSTLIKTKSKTLIDDFWDDCLASQENNIKSLSTTTDNKSIKTIIKKSVVNPPLKYTKNNSINIINKNDNKKILSSPNKKQNSKRTKNSKRSSSSSRISKVDKYVDNFYNKYPSLYEDEVENEKKIKLRNNAMNRCVNMYEYAIEQINYKKNLCDMSVDLKKKNEISGCTWKPKLYRRLNIEESKMYVSRYNIGFSKRTNKNKNINTNCYGNNICNDNFNNLGDMNMSTDKKSYKNKIQYQKDMKFKKGNLCENDYVNSIEDRMLHPSTNLKKMFDGNNTLINKENTDFYLRYSKARVDYLCKQQFLYPSKYNEYFQNSLKTEKEKQDKDKASGRKFLNTSVGELCSKQYLHSLLLNSNFYEEEEEDEKNNETE